jgi:hypothetical protein
MTSNTVQIVQLANGTTHYRYHSYHRSIAIIFLALRLLAAQRELHLRRRSNGRKRKYLVYEVHLALSIPTAMGGKAYGQQSKRFYQQMRALVSWNEKCLSLRVGGTVNRLTSAPVNMKVFDVFFAFPSLPRVRHVRVFLSLALGFHFVSLRLLLR